MLIEAVVEESRIGTGFQSFKPAAEAMLAASSELFRKKNPVSYGKLNVPPFHTSWLFCEVQGQRCFAFGGNIIHFCIKQNLFRKAGDLVLTHDPDEELVQAMFLENDALYRRAHPQLLAEKEVLLARLTGQK